MLSNISEESNLLKSFEFQKMEEKARNRVNSYSIITKIRLITCHVFLFMLGLYLGTQLALHVFRGQ